MKQFDFYKDNRISQRFAKNVDELSLAFNEWIRKQDKFWLEYYDAETVVRFFITAKDGLSSVYEEDQWDGIIKALKPIYKEFVYGQ